MKRNCLQTLLAASLATGAWSLAAPVHAQTVIEEWANVQRPPAPTLKAVTVDPQTTALLMLDFLNSSFGKRPRCLVTLPAMKNLLSQARARNMLVIYSGLENSTSADVMKDVAPRAGEPLMLSGPDKFFNTNLEQILKDKGIKTVITVGTAANGVVLYTGSAAVFRGMSVIVPVDGICSPDSYSDLVAVGTLMTAPRVSAATTFTQVDMLKF